MPEKSIPNERLKLEVLPHSGVYSTAAMPTFQPDGPSRNTSACSVGRCQKITQLGQVWVIPLHTSHIAKSLSVNKRPRPGT